MLVGVMGCRVMFDGLRGDDVGCRGMGSGNRDGEGLSRRHIPFVGRTFPFPKEPPFLSSFSLPLSLSLLLFASLAPFNQANNPLSRLCCRPEGASLGEYRCLRVAGTVGIGTGGGTSIRGGEKYFC